MGGFRAKDADRDRYVDVIEAAYVDGQLGDADRELRVARALTADTLDELDALTRDLQNRPALPVAPRPAPPVAASPRAHPTAQPQSSAGKVVGSVVIVVVGLVVVAGVASTGTTEDMSGSSVEYSEVPWEQLESSAEERGFVMTPRGVRELVAAYHEQFGTSEAYEVVLRPRQASVQVPVAGKRGRSERWTWDGTWTMDADAGVATEARGRVDLGDLDPGRLADNVRTARGAVRVEKGRFDRAVLSREGDGPAMVTIRVTNQFHETGSVSTTPAGVILDRQPFVP
jgi:hypothetical protein